jgi:ABC-type branched-subunit amino acid transport system ATPase component
MTVLLRAEALNKSFGGVRAVNGCSFTLREGSVTGLIGPNGAGKSTAIDLLSGFQRPDSGSAFLDGVPLIGKAPHDISRLGLIRTFQSPREWASLSVLDNLLLAMREYGRESIWRGVLRPVREAPQRVRAREILDRFGLGSLINAPAGTLSGGQKRLLEFARIAAAGPRLLILDEPMGGVNPVLGERIHRAIRDFVAHGSTVVVVEHNLRFIEETCDEVIVMSLGAVIAQGPYAALRNDPQVVDAYLGEVQDHV